MANKDELVFLPLGGSGEIGMNMNCYGFGPPKNRKWVMIDCGVMFGDLSMPGIELICPDPSFILEENLLGLLLTHGHEDHIGAVALLAPKLQCPVFATPFTAKLVEAKLLEAGVSVDLRVINTGARFTLGPFDLEYLTLTHSIPEPSGIAIRTPITNVLHTGDWKLDPTPTIGPCADEAAIKSFAAEGISTMVCDSTNVFSTGVSGSETQVKETLATIIKEQKGRVAVTTFASNFGRVVSICLAAKDADRSVCLLGRSMLRIVDAARATGLLPEDITFVSAKEAAYIPREHILFLCTGSQGEPRAALSRMARDDHPDVSLTEGDTVIFSSKVIPGNEREIYTMQNDLVELGVHLIGEGDAFVHVSGHPNQDELKKMYGWVEPDFVIPVHGEARHLERHAEFAIELGVEGSLSPRNGDLIRIAPGDVIVIDEVPNGRLMLDGSHLMPTGSPALNERKKLSFAGLVMVSLALEEAGELATTPIVELVGTPTISGNGELTDALLVETAEDAFYLLSAGRRRDPVAIETAVTRAVRNRMMETWGKRPIVRVMIHRV
ncbi:MAG: ribonuclease J [Pseudomonadota bacterium]